MDLDVGIDSILSESLNRYGYNPLIEANQNAMISRLALEYLAIRVMEGSPTRDKIAHAADIFKKYFIMGNIREGYVGRHLRDPKEIPELVKELDDTEDTNVDSILQDISYSADPTLALAGMQSIKKSVGKIIPKHKESLKKKPGYRNRFNSVKRMIVAQATGESKDIPLREIKINLDEVSRERLDENFLHMMGAWIRYFLSGIMGDFDIPVTIKGKKRDVELFAKAVGSEKKYLETAKHYGLDHATTYKSKSMLSNAVGKFEKVTGIKWPFK